jgi:hypothetical protein
VTHLSPLRAVATGVAAGAAGTAAMTTAQTTYYKKTGGRPSTTPAEVAKRIIRGVLQRDVSDDKTDILNNATHWSYGTTWGALLGIVAGSSSAPPPPVRTGIAFGVFVWAAGTLVLNAMQLAPPVWKWDRKAIGSDLGFHLVYGVTAATAFRLLAWAPADGGSR